MKTKTIEIAYDHKNRDVYFRPAERTVRGRFLLRRVNEPTAMSFRGKIPEEVPGQTLGIDVATQTGYLIEPIHQNSEIKSNIEKRGMKIEPVRQEFENVDVNAWLFWMKRAVEDGKATVLSGELPETINYDPPSRLGPQPKRGEARLREIFRRDPRLALEHQRMTAEEKQAWESAVGV